ncbi:M14 family metallopeptidase [Rufibacter sp. LB8]|uniref:M14 family metallopeptidase n=1 Tax=Rufibacter sp. LB8 TaxID=2777781 RepID=UPI00178C571E|nr:M14 family metallopeptidase [Rufibacter sp. LB8]
MIRSLKSLGLLLALVGASVSSVGQSKDYPSYAELTTRLQHLAAQYSKHASLTTIGKTATGKEVWLLTLGRENATNKPALVIAAGVEPKNLAAIEMSLMMAERLLQSAQVQDSVLKLLQTKTIYILPNLNPDATEQYHEKLRWERTGNAQPADEDRDGRIFEDPFEDLNNDGLITQMRIQDSTGLYIPSAVDPRVMVLADPSKGEKGVYRVLSEGIDNDKDGRWNEDPEGGVHFNKNFSYDFPNFQEGAGEHPMSERETKAFADFLFESRNVYAVFVLGAANTLTIPWESTATNAQKGVTTGLLEKDKRVNHLVSELYKKSVSAQGAASTKPGPGDVIQWAYFHYGRYSFGTPAWWHPPVALSSDSATASAALSEYEDVNFLRWAEHEDVPGVFIPWQKIKHPDFPGQTVEIGGLVPYVKFTPPKHLLAPFAQKHLQFFTAFAMAMPSLKITSLTTQVAGKGMTRVIAEVENTGNLPTHSEMGERSSWVQKVKITLQLEDDQKLTEGTRIKVYPALPAGGKVQVSWLVSGTGFVTVEAHSPMAGTQTKEILLKR